MAPIVEKRENTQAYTATNPSNKNFDRTNGKLFLYNGSYQMVFVDNSNNGREYITDKSGKKLYLDEIAIFQLQEEKEAQEKKLMSSFDNQKKLHEKWKNYWLEKFNLENFKYDTARIAKQVANKGYQGVLTEAGCSSLEELKEYQNVNGGNFIQRATDYLTKRSDARKEQISSEAMSAFYGRMYVDESSDVANIETQKILAKNSVFS